MCFQSFKKFGKLEAILAENMWKATGTMPKLELELALSGTKEGRQDDEHGSENKRPSMD